MELSLGAKAETKFALQDVKCALSHSLGLALESARVILC